MDYKDWLILQTIQEEKNLTRAAKKLFISQPALTFRLKKLEQEFHATILIRHSNGVSFTPQGEYLLEHAKETLRQLEEVKQHVRQMESVVQGSIRLGISSVVAKFKMASLLKRFQNQFPHIHVELLTGSSTLQLPLLLAEDQLDVVILRGDPQWGEGKHTLSEEPWCIVSAQGSDLEKLPQTPWIQYKASTITGSLNVQYAWWEEQYSEAPTQIIKVDSIEACLEMISHGLGWSMMPKAHLVNHRSLAFKPAFWKTGEGLTWKTTMLYENQKRKDPVIQLFINYILQEYSAR